MGAETTTVAVDAAVLPVVGCLDGEAGLRLLAAVRGVLAAGAVRLEVDLCQVADFTPPGAAALLACRHLADTLGDDRSPGCVEVHYRTSRGPGREALLAAFAAVRDDDDPDTDDPAGSADHQTPGDELGADAAGAGDTIDLRGH